MSLWLCILTLFVAIKAQANPYPVQIVKGLLVTTAIIDGEEVAVIFDTGAPGLVLNSSYYKGDDQEVLPCFGVTGTFECQTHLVKEWTWMEKSQKRTNALVSDLSFIEHAVRRKIHALIGLSAVQDYFITIDYQNSSIHLGEKYAYQKKDVIRFHYADHLPVVQARINGQKKWLGIDTGAEANFLIQPAGSLNAIQLAAAIPCVVTGTSNTPSVRHSLAYQLDIVGSSTASTEFLVDLNQEGISEEVIDGLIGQSFLAGYVVTIHPVKQIIVLRPANKPSAETTLAINTQ